MNGALLSQTARRLEKILTEQGSAYDQRITYPQIMSWLGSVPTNDVEFAATVVLASAGLAAAPTETKGTSFLTPPGWQTPLSAVEIRRELGTSEAPLPRPTPPEWNNVLAGRASDAEYQAVFPARVASDLAVRRERLATVAHAWRERPERWRAIVEEGFRWGWDYVFAMNIATQSFLCDSDDWWGVAHEIGLLPAGLTDYIERAKKLTGLLKTRSSNLKMTQWAECAGLTGYRQPPIEGFDLRKEAEDLATGGGRGIGTPGVTFASQVPIALAMNVPRREYVSFEDYIRSGEWATAGASSVGRVEVEYVEEGEEKQFKFKPSKSQLREVMTDDEIIDYVEAHTEQVNVAIVKAELAKLRIAVSGDLATYLRMSWLTRLLNSAYNDWPGSTTEEGLAEQTNRLIMMLQTLKKHWGLPFDFKAFDHQPTTEEILLIVDWLFAHMMQNVPVERAAEVRRQMAIVRGGFEHAVLIVRDEGGDTEFAVRGGLMSGLRWTSIIGNAWNSVVTACVIESLAGLGISRAVVARWIRGDDSAIVCLDWQSASVVAHAFQWVGAEGGFGKFSIWPEEFEFLRQQVGPDGVSAYGVRAVPGWSQRKPWTNEPWRPFASLEAQAEVRDLLIRRGYDEGAVWRLWRATASAYCRKKRVALRWLTVPAALGGLGLEPWQGWLPSERLPTPRLPELTIKNSIGRTLADVERIAASINPEYSRVEARSIAERELQPLLLSNARPEVLRLLREPVFKVGWHKVEVIAPRAVWTEGPRLQTLQPVVGVVEQLTRSAAPLWGAGREVEAQWRDWSRVERATGVKPIDLLRQRSPVVAAWLRLLERRGLRRRDALDWLFGSTSFALNGLNPSVLGLVSSATRSYLGDITRGSWRGSWAQSVYVYSVYASSMLARSRWYRTLYRN